MRQDQKQLVFWLCPGCTADAREKEKREQLDKRAVTSNTTPVKPSAAVKLPDDEEDEDNDNDDGNAEEGGMKVEEFGKQDKVDKPRENGESGPSGKAAGPGGNNETSIATGGEKGAQDLGAAGGGGPREEGNKSSKGELSTSQGLGGLPDGTGVGEEGARGPEDQKQGSPGERSDKDAELAAGAAPGYPKA